MTCDHRLQALFREVVKHVDCTVLQGHRGREEQTLYHETGKSQLPWPMSAHNTTPSRAVDVVPYPIDWNDIPRFQAFAAVVKEQAARMGIKIRHGGDFKSFKDYPHWELID